MLQNNVSEFWHLKLLSSVAISGVIAISGDPIFAQVLPDSSLGAESSIVKSVTVNGITREQIEGGAVRNINLFHSFRDFNVVEGQSLYFQNPAGVENIISRVTGGNPSSIQGTLGVSGGTANLFLINPSGIIFGANARLDVNGSFVATTANAIQFGTQGFFSSSAPDSPSLLTVNPSAFLFNQVAHASIVNLSTAPLATGVQDLLVPQGLQVPEGQSLLLLGGDVNLTGGGVNTSGGRVELGGVAGAGTIGLSSNGADLRLSFPANIDRADISLTNGATVNTSGEGGGSIQIWGRRVLVNGGSQVSAFTQGAKPGGDLIVDASESVELLGLVPAGNLSTLTFGAGNAGNITINTQKLIVGDGAQILSGTFGNGSAGQLTVNASESVELSALYYTGNGTVGSALASFTGSTGNAGNITINTKRLILRDGGVLSTESLFAFDNGRFIAASGQGGNLTVNASESVELIRQGLILTDTIGPGNAGNITINTGSLLVQDSGIGAQSEGSGNAGNIAIQARSVSLKNQAQIISQSASSEGGNITLQGADLLLLRQGSLISTTAGTANAGGNGGNITLNSQFVVAVPTENSDISANAFTGNGGNIQINAQGIYGTQFRPSATPLSDITASSQYGVSGTVTLNTPNVIPIRGTVALPTGLIDTDALIANSCVARSRRQGRFVITGTGGLSTQPDDLAIASFPTYELIPDAGKLGATDSPQQSSSSVVESDGIYRLTTGEVILSRSCQ